MTADRDAQLLQLFSKHRRLLVNEAFAARVVWQIELERKERAWQKALWMVVVLCMTAFASVWIVEGLSFLSSELATGLRMGEPSDERASPWLVTGLVSFGAIGFATLWRLLRNEN
jgi:hypothetical protein